MAQNPLPPFFPSMRREFLQLSSRGLGLLAFSRFAPAGLHGTVPDLNLAPNQDITYSTDFRSVYATLLDRWLACPSESVLGGKFAGLSII
jgi:hypothetical protein